MRSDWGEEYHFVFLSPDPQFNANWSKLCIAVGFHSDPPQIGCKRLFEVHLENYIEWLNSFETSIENLDNDSKTCIKWDPPTYKNCWLNLWFRMPAVKVATNCSRMCSCGQIFVQPFEITNFGIGLKNEITPSANMFWNKHSGDLPKSLKHEMFIPQT